MNFRRDHTARVLIWIIWLLICLGMLIAYRLRYGPAVQL